MRIGVDLGGTKIEAVVLDNDGKELIRKRVPTPSTDYTKLLAAIKQLIHDVESAVGKSNLSIGIGTPGSLSPSTGLLRNSNTVCLNGKPIREDLEKTLNRPVRIANDANCFALSEATDGAAKSFGIVFGVIVGTGTGGGIVINGKVINGANAVAGEWGHNALPWIKDSERHGHQCFCGKDTCIETFLAGPALERLYFKETGQKKSGQEIASLVAINDTSASQVLSLYEDQMARALASVMNVIDPDIIVLGGGVSNINRLYENVPKIWNQYIFADKIVTKLVKAKYGDSSGVRGAAWLWEEQQ